MRMMNCDCPFINEKLRIWILNFILLIRILKVVEGDWKHLLNGLLLQDEKAVFLVACILAPFRQVPGKEFHVLFFVIFYLKINAS